MAKRHISLPNGFHSEKKKRIVKGLEGLLETVQTWSKSQTIGVSEKIEDHLRSGSKTLISQSDESYRQRLDTAQEAVERSYTEDLDLCGAKLRKDTAHEEFSYGDLTESGIPWCRYCGTTKASCFSNGPWKDEEGKVIPRVLCQACMCKICPPKSLSKSKCKEMVEEVSHFLKSLPVEPINPALNKEKVFKKGLLKKLNVLLKNKEKQPPDNIVDTFWEWAYKENPERLGRTLMVNYMRAWVKSLPTV